MAALNPMKSNGKSGTPEIADLEAQLAKLTSDLATLGKTVAAYGGARATEVGEQARSLTETMTEQARVVGEAIAERSGAAAEVARARLVSAEGRIEDGIRANPLAAIGIAAGVGFLAALMAKR